MTALRHDGIMEQTEDKQRENNVSTEKAPEQKRDCAACPRLQTCGFARPDRSFMPHARMMFFSGKG